MLNIVLVVLILCGSLAAQQGTDVMMSPLTNQHLVCGYGVPCLADGHTGLDLSDTGNNRTIKAAGPGTIAHLQLNALGCGCPQGKNCGCADHDMGNTIIIRHTMPNGTPIYTQYSHLDSFSPGLHEGQTVSHNDTIGIMGSTGNGRTDNYSIHLHFEVKDQPVLSNPTGAGQHWGYTGGPSPDNYGYHNPEHYINTQRLLTVGQSSVTDTQITALANTTQPVRWFYIMNQTTGAWYIVSPTSEVVMFLDKVDRNSSFGVYWRPVNNASFTSYADAGRNFGSINISSDGRTISFGGAIASTGDPHVFALANTVQPVRWFYIMNESTGAWYIVSPSGASVMELNRVDQSYGFGIFWKPINNSVFQTYPDAGQNYGYVNISSDGRTVYFGPLR